MPFKVSRDKDNGTSDMERMPYLNCNLLHAEPSISKLSTDVNVLFVQGKTTGKKKNYPRAFVQSVLEKEAKGIMHVSMEIRHFMTQ